MNNRDAMVMQNLCPECGSKMVVDKINLGGAMETHCPLHAAAPDLLAALKGLVQVIQELGECNRPEYEKAWAAISRAEGKE